MAVRTKSQLLNDIATLLASAQPDKIEASEHRQVLNNFLDSLGQTEFQDDLSITTPKIQDEAVTNDKLAQMPAFTVKGNPTGSLADPTDVDTLNIEDAGNSCFTSEVNGAGLWLGGSRYRDYESATITAGSGFVSLFSGITNFKSKTGALPTATSFYPTSSLKTLNAIVVDMFINVGAASTNVTLRGVFGGQNLSNFVFVAPDVAVYKVTLLIVVDTVPSSVGGTLAQFITVDRGIGSQQALTTGLDTISAAGLDIEISNTGGNVTRECLEIYHRP